MKPLVPSKKWEHTARIYGIVSGEEFSASDREQMFAYESLGSAKFREMFPDASCPPKMQAAKELLNLMTTEILDLLKYSLCFGHWYFLYKTDVFMGGRLNREVLDYILQDKALTPYQIAVQEKIWESNREAEAMLEKFTQWRSRQCSRTNRRESTLLGKAVQWAYIQYVHLYDRYFWRKYERLQSRKDDSLNADLTVFIEEHYRRQEELADAFDPRLQRQKHEAHRARRLASSSV